jgi:hypothetical protein
LVESARRSPRSRRTDKETRTCVLPSPARRRPDHA